MISGCEDRRRAERPRDAPARTRPRGSGGPVPWSGTIRPRAPAPGRPGP